MSVPAERRDTGLLLAAGLRRAEARLGRAADWADAHVRVCLAGIVAGQIAIAAGMFAFAMTRNRWLPYEGGDQIWYVTSGWLVGHGTIPYALLGFGGPVLLAPLTWITGSSSVAVLPLAIAIEVLVLAPIATLAVYDIGARIAGRVAGLWCAAFVVVAPVLATPLFVHRYRSRWVDEVLPGFLGFNQLGDFPSTVVVLVAAALVLRSLEEGARREAVLGGIAAGLAIGIKPANVLFLVAPGLAYLIARRFGTACLFAASLAPAVITLGLWKYRGRGELITSLPVTHLAAGHADPVPIGGLIPHQIDLDVWKRNMSNLREFFWSARLAQWAPLAGALAVARRSLPAAGLLLGWMLAFVFVKGASEVASIEGNSFWRLVMPGLPAYGILVAAVPLLVPTLPRRLGERIAPLPARQVGTRTTMVVVALVGLVPFLVVAASSPARGTARAIEWNGILTPVDGSVVRLTATRAGSTVRLSWTDSTKRARTFYRVFRTTGTEDDTRCRRVGVDQCVLEAATLTVTRARTYVDRKPQPGAIYRIGVAANSQDDTTAGDVFMISPPVHTT